MRSIVMVVLVLAASQGCGTCQRTEADDKVERAVSAYEAMANIAVQYQGQCDLMASELTKFVEANKQTFEDVKSLKASAAEEKRLEEKYKSRMEAAMQKMMGPLTECPQAAVAIQSIS